MAGRKKRRPEKKCSVTNDCNVLNESRAGRENMKKNDRENQKYTARKNVK